MAHKKGVGSSENGRDSKSKRLGVKLYGGQAAKAGSIIIRQRGSKYHLGENTYFGKDWTLHAKIDGTVKYTKGRKKRTFVHVIPADYVDERLDVQPKAKKAKAAPVAKAAPAAPAPVVEAPKAEAPAAPVEVKEEAPVMAAAPAAPKAAAGKKDDLRKIEGVGPKIASLLNDAGMLTFADVAAADAAKIKEVLVAAGSRYGFHDPTTWPMQAKMAAEGRWDELKKWQDESDGGKPVG